MLKSYGTYITEKAKRKSVWPKIVTWNKGEDLDTSRVLGSIAGEVYNYLREAITLNHIAKLIKTSESASEKYLTIILIDGEKSTFRLNNANQGLTMPTDWKQVSGLKKLRDDNKHQSKSLIDWDYIMCLPGYVKLIEKFDMQDLTTDKNRTDGFVVLDSGILRHYYRDHEKIESENTRCYKIYTTDKITCGEGLYAKDHRTIKRIHDMQSWKDFELLFDKVIQNEVSEREYAEHLDRDEERKKLEDQIT